MGRRHGWVTVGSAAIVMALTLAGCSARPSVGDGSLGVDWAVLPTPTVPTPEVGKCTGRDATTPSSPNVGWDMSIYSASPQPTVECTAEHLAETYFVGTFPADAETDAAGRPKLGTALFRSAYESCTQKAIDFLGADFHTGRLSVLPVMPSDRQWAGKARWYRCELLEIVDSNGTINPRTGSLKDGLRGTKPLALTCGDEKLSADQKYLENITFTGCTTPHDIELTGIYVASDGDYPGDAKINDIVPNACYGIGATYLGMTRAMLDSTGGIRWLFWGGTRDLWSAGDRSMRCFMGAYPRTKLTGSIKGRAPGTFPH
jgi:hypothetical protein